MDSKLWEQNLMCVVKEIARENIQRNLWLGKGERISSLEEVYCKFFDDFLAEKFIELHKDDASKETVTRFIELIKKLENFETDKPEYKNPEKLIASNEWDKVRQKARKLLDAWQFNL